MFPTSLIVLLLAVVLLLKPIAEYIIDSKNLRRFPNYNVLSGITNLGYMIERWRGFRSKTLHDCHKVHPVVRIGPNSLSFSSVSAMKAIYGHSTTTIKGDMYSDAAGPYPNILDAVSKDVHAHKRRLLSHAFATRNLEQWEFKIADKVERLVKQFDRICDTPEATLDYSRWTNLFTLDAIVDIALSYRLGCLDRGDDVILTESPDGKTEAVNYIESLHAVKRATSVIVWSSAWFGMLRSTLKLVPGFFRNQYSRGQGYDHMVAYLTQRRMQRYRDGEALDDLLQCILEDKEGKPQELESGEVEAEVNVLLDAGSDTTATALVNVMYYLLQNPSTLVRLRRELEDLSDDNSVVSYSRVKDLPYLRACLDESLRLSPPLAFGLNRKTGPDGVWVDGNFIPAATIVAVPAYTAHRNPAIFTDPEEFRPERWLCAGSKELQASFIPFSAGARGCIGRNITYMEQLILMATLVRRYDFSFVDPDWKLDYEEAFILWPSHMLLNISLRQHSCS
ncbi:cytochrome P450 [Truncatella angustata]|uniref:Cytochrome P450 n=1 Tax=Truncatella angustata TaxID=152316 RepID=A0A9P8RJG9_9PEZI|nr:cytochrome P450 [Truncatella angustata]KAH6645433.1 cytochrome P450 [Truncatella angustata]KAH8198209.1 hypothetical protein TruAng_007636 [Truncatella angustata]